MDTQRRAKIMLVDDNQANLSIGKNLLKDQFEVYALPSAERLFRFLESVEPDVILLDIEMPQMDGYEVIKKLKADIRYSHIPVIFVTSKTDGSDEEKGLDLGAEDYVTKPFSAAILIKRIKIQLLISALKAKIEQSKS